MTLLGASETIALAVFSTPARMGRPMGALRPLLLLAFLLLAPTAAAETSPTDGVWLCALGTHVVGDCGANDGDRGGLINADNPLQEILTAGARVGNVIVCVEIDGHGPELCRVA